jgi:hypothetical protein
MKLIVKISKSKSYTAYSYSRRSFRNTAVRIVGMAEQWGGDPMGN